MPLIEKATTYILDALLQNEEFKKFPQDFIGASVRWVRSWFLDDDPKTEAKLTSNKSKDYKQGVIETKLEDLLENSQFKQELEAKLAEWERHTAAVQQAVCRKNTVEASTIKAGGDVRIGDESYQAGGNIQIVHHYGQKSIQPEPPPLASITKPAVSPAVKRQLQDLVGSNRTKEAIDQLLKLSEGHPEFRKLVLAQSERWEQLKRHEMMNVLSFAEAGNERAKIVSAVLDLVGELEG